ncbi:MAG: dTDP-4-dehydrorhamnose 3,5-epimerase family protein [Flavobacteriales bacterium]|nr:dTDP-4-dehydrorhamnose 3,5-epimerase family protein [Flavobacteriales bacterium]
MSEPKLIAGGNHSDNRGELSFVNDFDFSDVSRFYIVSNSKEKPLRAWQGHRYDHKYFYCVNGSFKIFYVKVDNWEQPSSNLTVKCVELNQERSQVFYLPSGYANAILSLEEDSKLITFSKLKLEDTEGDYFRYDEKMWNINFDV